jgi:preprotein translocase subunit SecG
MDLLITLLYLVFVFSAIVLIVVILLQEGRGGGFGQALGEGGQQTFGVGAKGINTFTGYTAILFLASAIAIHALTLEVEGGSALDGQEVNDR